MISEISRGFTPLSSASLLVTMRSGAGDRKFIGAQGEMTVTGFRQNEKSRLRHCSVCL